MWVLSYIGPSTLGPAHVSLFNVVPLDALSLGWDMLAVAVFSLIILYLALSSALPREEADRYFADLKKVELLDEYEEGAESP